ncbi:MAG TPA: hypothetical protein VF244_03940, partial [Acidimicrobiales bacterium]
VPNAYGEWASFRQPLYEPSTRPYSSAMTAEAAGPGQPGAIVNVPELTFGLYAPGELPPGRYRIGVACTLYNEVVRYWDAELVVTQSAGDEPAGVTWAVADPAAGDRSSGLPVGAGAAGLVTAAVLTGIYARRRLRPRSPTASRRIS